MDEWGSDGLWMSSHLVMTEVTSLAVQDCSNCSTETDFSEEVFPVLCYRHDVVRMFVGYEDAEDSEAYDDELYHEESSSEQSVDSEVEFHLYSQIHYSQNLGEISTLEMDEEADVAGVTSHSSVLTEKQHEDKEITELIDGGAQLSDDPEIIVLSDTPDEDSVYKSKAKKSTSSSAQGTDISRQRKSTGRKLNPVSSAGACAIQDVLVIDDSSEEESLISESENVESWMLLGAGVDDRDENIMLNLEGCATPVSEG
ncbi:zinc finger CCHC domain-containing protein 7 [Antrostomus carolinensis]|uniref:zinc finger CCHC domain-containing protein 7 n=1 Tax=Antrostomus carolinensis TaxID=279965 RepID=UPI0010A98251|nr:zinc finger CCHC domain-containing protein 7 [Antrostomus carolinensis]